MRITYHIFSCVLYKKAMFELDLWHFSEICALYIQSMHVSTSQSFLAFSRTSIAFPLFVYTALYYVDLWFQLVLVLLFLLLQWYVKRLLNLFFHSVIWLWKPFAFWIYFYFYSSCLLYPIILECWYPASQMCFALLSASGKVFSAAWFILLISFFMASGLCGICCSWYV